ncbi:MAG: hypothetical protein IPF82_16455 [Blastocatellia bacterium]|nr:hypothetical protein [Blastocatellia bacterium]
MRRELAHTLRVATIGELAPSIVHELNQPLTSVLTNACAAERFLAADSPNLDGRTILRDIVDDDRRWRGHPASVDAARQARSSSPTSTST